MGSSTACGHYVAHVFKGGRWVIFNDEKVRGHELLGALGAGCFAHACLARVGRRSAPARGPARLLFMGLNRPRGPVRRALARPARSRAPLELVAHARLALHPFNNTQVAASEAPPRSLGYMYLYAREDTPAAQAAAAAGGRAS